MRVMGLDVGEKRIGIALSDETGTIAQGKGIYRRRTLEEDTKHLAEKVQEWGVVRIVVGLPLNMDGTEGKQARTVREFARALGEAAGIPVELWDERLTSAEAERVLLEADLSRRKRRRMRDELAAVLILQSWLDAHRGSARVESQARRP
ncbi:MAG TPA: Holliday junction resolvase RuvX [Candidatus Acetothermia bacterium]|nr:Holliday junction resolvase RuvX [Candidatus Acetothermia bacterium]